METQTEETNTEEEHLTQKKFIKELIKIFADETSCNIQYNNSPCNSCFHNMNNKIDYNHILWIILLSLRGDYNNVLRENLNLIKKELIINKRRIKQND